MGKIWLPTPVLLVLSPTFNTSFEFISGVGGIFGDFDLIFLIYYGSFPVVF